MNHGLPARLIQTCHRLALTLLFAFPVACSCATAAGPAKPNFVVILIDDMGYGDIGPFGSKLNRTPNLDRMAAEGMRLTSFYAAPVCTPSRAQMMTGCYAKRISMPHVIFPSCPTGLSTNEYTIARLLKQQGYATMAIGKWHLGDQPEFLPTRHGFDQYLGLPYSNDMGGPGDAAAAKKKGNQAQTRPPLPLLRDSKVIEAPAQQDTLTTRYTEAAVKFITANQERPFFLYFPQTAVHVPLYPGPAFKGKSGNGTYGDWVEEVDWSVGRVLDTLRALKLAERTLVLFTSDNGPWLTQGTNGGVAGPLHGGKGTTWEGGMREPTIAWWPGKVPAHSACDAPMSEIDVLPTLARLAGADLPASPRIDGKDVWPLLSGQAKNSPHEALYYFSGLKLEAVRSGAWKLAIAPQGTGMRPGAAEPVKHTGPRLYNLDTDIGELSDVAAQHPEVVDRLQKLVQQMDADLGIAGQGPGVRPPGRVDKPQPLLKTLSAEKAPANPQKAARRAKRAASGAKSDRLAPTHEDVRYGPYPRNVLDLWLAKSERRTPLLVFIHGGGFVAGDKSQISSALIQRCLDAGVSFMAINYRFRKDAPVQDILRDAARAIQFVRANATEYNLDPRRIASFGGSAGAGTSLWLATHDDLADPTSADPVLRQSSRILAAGCVNGQATYDLVEWQEVIGKFQPEWFESPDEDVQFYHFRSREDFKTPAGQKVLDDCSMLRLISPGDAPIFMTCSVPSKEPDSRNALLHHPRHMDAVKQKCDQAGVEVHIVSTSRDAAQQGAGQQDLLRFLLKHLEASGAQ